MPISKEEWSLTGIHAVITIAQRTFLSKMTPYLSFKVLNVWVKVQAMEKSSCSANTSSFTESPESSPQSTQPQTPKSKKPEQASKLEMKGKPRKATAKKKGSSNSNPSTECSKP